MIAAATEEFIYAGVKFATVNNILLPGTILIIVGMCMVVYIGLFVGNPSSSGATTDTNEKIETSADSSSEKKTPKKPRTPARKKKTEELGHIMSPEGVRSSARLRNRTPAHRE